MGAVTFEFGSSGAITVLGKHTFNISEDAFQFEADFEVATSSLHTDAEFQTALDAAYAYAGKNKDFKLKVGSSETFFDISANTGFLTQCEIRNTGDPRNSARYRVLRAVITGQFPATDDSRAGRRQASVILSRGADDVQRVTFSGTWTAHDTGPVAALANYDAGIVTWINTWLTGVLNPSSGHYWVRVGEPQIEIEEQDKVLQFSYTYEEKIYDVATPGDVGDPEAVPRSFTLTSMPVTLTGATPGLQYNPGKALLNALVLGAPFQVTSAAPGGIAAGGAGGAQVGGAGAGAGGGYAVGKNPPSRFSFQIGYDIRASQTTPQTYYTNRAISFLKDYFNDYFDTNEPVFESLEIAYGDVASQTLVIRGVAVIAGQGNVISYRETISINTRYNRQYAKVFNGKPHNYDITGGMTEQIATQRVEIRTLSGSPRVPAYLTSPWDLADENEAHNRDTAGTTDFKQSDVDSHTFTRTYVRVDLATSLVPFAAQTPFGSVGAAPLVQ